MMKRTKKELKLKKDEMNKNNRDGKLEKQDVGSLSVNGFEAKEM